MVKKTFPKTVKCFLSGNVLLSSRTTLVDKDKIISNDREYAKRFSSATIWQCLGKLNIEI